LLRNLHESGQCEASFALPLCRSHVGLSKLHELKVVEGTHGQVVVELLHHIPRPVPHAYHDDGQREVASRHDGFHGVFLLQAVCLQPYCTPGSAAARGSDRAGGDDE
jgi:hypothetical protein